MTNIDLLNVAPLITVVQCLAQLSHSKKVPSLIPTEAFTVWCVHAPSVSVWVAKNVSRSECGCFVFLPMALNVWPLL